MLKIPEDIEQIFNIFENHNHKLYLVGGCVRDLLLERTPYDYDFTTSATPEQMSIFLQQYGIINTRYQSFGTIQFTFHEQIYEITTFRKDGAYNDHRNPSTIALQASIDEDLSRRDFTINAICYHPKNGIYDPLHGQLDLKKQIIRSIGDPEKRLREDSLRLLRALRFQFELDFQIEEQTMIAIQKTAPFLSFVSKERIQKEWNRILLSDAHDILSTLKKANLLYYIIPSLQSLEVTQETPWHIYDVFTHTDVALNHSKHFSLEEKLALVFHDTGKQASKTIDTNGIAHFYQHSTYSIQCAQRALQQLRYPKKTIHTVLTLIHFHDERLQPNEKSVRTFLGKLNQNIPLAYSILRVQMADNSAKNHTYTQKIKKNLLFISTMIQTLSQEKLWKRNELSLNGHDVMDYGWKGKEVKIILNQLYQHIVLYPEHNSRTYLLSLLQKWKKNM